MRLLICGDRQWTSEHIIYNEILKHKDLIEVVIEGEARGTDTYARTSAQRAGIKVIPFPANWEMYHQAAGPIRNKQMLDEGKPTDCWAFHNSIIDSRGTADMVIRAATANLNVRIYWQVDKGFDYISNTSDPHGFSQLISALKERQKQRRKTKKKVQ